MVTQILRQLKNIYYTGYRAISWIGDIPREVKYFIQRGRRGYSDRDAWGINYYLSDIVPKMLRHMAKYNCGCPLDMFDESNKENQCHKWEAELIKFAEGWEAIGKVMNDEYITHTPLPKGETRKVANLFEVDYETHFDEKQMNAWIKQFKDMGPSFFEHFLGLWD